ncbi:flagellar basal body protein [Lachnobacterium bovis]|uniref:flagellar basal body protein n=1 Tax=Lachnobacterium bovis TaxID=140626 RepID=UPI001FA6DC33
MDVIGNNIANVNTEAFKASCCLDLLRLCIRQHQVHREEMQQNGVGGVNAKQIGLGVTTGSTKINITSAGAAETTGDPFDIKLTDSQTTNFFIVSDGKK